MAEKFHRNGFEEAAVAQPRHPLLTSWNPPTQHSFSRSQMKILTSLCDALSPAIDPPIKAAGEGSASDLDKSAFYGCSASDMGIPEDIAGLLGVLLKPRLLVAIRVVLWLLSTRLGTVILGGRASLTWHFPFVHSFGELPRPNQETILRRWSLSMFTTLCVLYKLFKMITMWAVYAKIEKNGRNRNWNAIGYCGADPHLDTRKQTEDPLRSFVIAPGREGLTKALTRAGVTVNGEESPEVRISCDVVVVGSGSGGGVAASVLAKAGHKVVVLEKGNHFTASQFSSLEGPSQMAMFEKLGSLATEDGGVNLVAGATVGGGTTINWSACFETPPHVLREWNEITNLELFTSARYQLAMKEVWRRLGVQPHVSAENLPNSMLRVGCERLGEEVGTLARNSPPDHECGWCTSGCARGQKASTARTWLVDAAETGNAVVLAECEAQRVLYSSGNHEAGKRKKHRARGVIARSGDTTLVIDARAVVMASGSLMTPTLLLRSGLRNANIGRNLHLHPVVFVWGYFPEDRGPPGTCYEGAILTSYSPILKRGSRAPAALLEAVSTHPGSFATFQPWTSAADFKERMARYSRTVTLCVVTRDQSAGRVSIDSNGDPMITYSLNEADERTALDGMEKGLRVLIAAGASEIGTHQHDGERFHITDAEPDEIDAYLRRVRARGVKMNRISMGSGHHMSSCSMGSDPKRSVVDGNGESWEVEGLFVCDGSVMPNAVGVNPMVTIQTLAYCIADNVLQTLETS